MSNKIVRTVCYFTDNPSLQISEKLLQRANKLEAAGYVIQTKRVCSNIDSITKLRSLVGDSIDYASIGTISAENLNQQLEDFSRLNNVACNVDLTSEVEKKHVDILFRIIKEKPEFTFGFSYVFNNAASSPYFPSANYKQNGFAVGLQATDLSEGCSSLQEWLDKCRQCWEEITGLLKDNDEFLGIDSSIAPLFTGSSSLVNFVKRLGYDFSRSTTTNLYTTMTSFIKTNNPKPVGLCGLMVPCLEDAELAAEYEAGNFSIERNIYLSLHSGLGIDVYPIGIDEKPERVIEILKTIQALSNKYKKPLSARFVSDGKAKIGEKTDFKNQYLADCTVRPL